MIHISISLSSKLYNLKIFIKLVIIIWHEKISIEKKLFKEENNKKEKIIKRKK